VQVVTGWAWRPRLPRATTPVLWSFRSTEGPSRSQGRTMMTQATVARWCPSHDYSQGRVILRYTRQVALNNTCHS